MPLWNLLSPTVVLRAVPGVQQTRGYTSVQAGQLRKKLKGGWTRKTKMLVTQFKPNGKFTMSSKLKQMKAVQLTENGGPEVLRMSSIPVPAVGPGEVLIQNIVAGANFIDTYHRSGLYKRELPVVLGTEGAGEVLEAGGGPGEGQSFVGKKVVYWGQPSYCQYTVAKASEVVRIPASISPETACAAFLQGMTAHYLTHSCYRVQPGDTVVVHAAGGGTGQLLVQISKILGARVIGTCSEGKRELAKSLGCDVVCGYDELEEVVKKETDGEGVPVVYDGVGKRTWESSLNSLRTRGNLIFFGNASGPPPPIDPLLLSPKSAILQRPKLNDFTRDREELEWRSGDIFGWLASGKLKVTVDTEFSLDNAKAVHEYLEAGKTAGKVLITVPKSKLPREDIDPSLTAGWTAKPTISESYGGTRRDGGMGNFQ